MAELKDILKSIRERKNLSQQEMADRLDINRATYAFYEQGRNLPKGAFYTKFKQEFGVDLLDTNVSRETISLVSLIGAEGHQIDFPQSATGWIVKQVRSALGISQLEFGNRIGRSKDLVLRIERGDRNVTLLTWVLTFHYLNTMPADDFEKVRQIFDEKQWLTAGFSEDEDDEDYRRGSQTGHHKQVEFLQGIIESQKTVIAQKDLIIQQLQSIGK